MALCKEVTSNQEAQCYHQFTVLPCVAYRTFLGFRLLATKLEALIPTLAIAGNSESIWDMTAVIITIVTMW